VGLVSRIFAHVSYVLLSYSRIAASSGDEVACGDLLRTEHHELKERMKKVSSSRACCAANSCEMAYQSAPALGEV
jgi:hypothetical protein